MIGYKPEALARRHPRSRSSTTSGRSSAVAATGRPLASLGAARILELHAQICALWRWLRCVWLAASTALGRRAAHDRRTAACRSSPRTRPCARSSTEWARVGQTQDRQRRAHSRRPDHARADERARSSRRSTSCCGRSAATWPRRARSPIANASRFDRIIVMPTSAAPRPAPSASAPPPHARAVRSADASCSRDADDDDDDAPAPNVAAPPNRAARSSTRSRSRRSSIRSTGRAGASAGPGRSCRRRSGRRAGRRPPIAAAAPPARSAASPRPAWSRQPPHAAGPAGSPVRQPSAPIADRRHR